MYITYKLNDLLQNESLISLINITSTYFILNWNILNRDFKFLYSSNFITQNIKNIKMYKNIPHNTIKIWF